MNCGFCGRCSDYREYRFLLPPFAALLFAMRVNFALQLAFVVLH